MNKEIKRITSREVILGVRKRWSDQYKDYDPEYELGSRHNREAVGVIRKRLKALDLETCTLADVDKAIGTENWADNECDVCGGNHDLVIRIGDDPNYEARWVDVCPSCLSKASDLARSPQDTEQ